jgi:hypothetical protein
MQKIYASNEAEVIKLLFDMKPKGNTVFIRPSGLPIATWIVLAGIGELYTKKSIRRLFGKKSLLTYDYFTNQFSGEAYEKEDNKSTKAKSLHAEREAS